MKKKYILTGILIAAMALPASSFTAAASSATDDGTMPVVVSLGDSYSSGEGIEPYYGQDSVDKYDIEDWVCHRSELSWPGMLEINGTTLSSVRGTNYSCADGLVSTEGTRENWYFGAVSGAVTQNIYSDNDQDRQVKTVSSLVGQRSDTRYQLNFQIDTITSLPDPSMVDYVTLTIGGNDVDFTGIITEAMLSDYVNLSKDGLKQKLVNTIESFWETTDGSTPMAEKLENMYRKILEAAPNAKLIVAGYPQLIHYDTKIPSSLYTDNQSITELAGDVVLTISDSEAKLIDDAVSTFDQYIKTIVESRMDGENIAFVDVQDAFAGHEAYSDDPYIEGLVLGLSENVDKSGTGTVISSASFHPNEKGAKAYAGAVQEVFTQYDENPVLAVCDETGNPYGDFAVKIEGTQYTEQFLSGSHLTLSMPTSYSQEMNADSTEPLQLTLTKRDYTITVTDQSNPENSISKDIKVRKNYDGKVIRMSGGFGAGNTADAYAAYEVILDEYRAACAVDSMSYFADMETYEAMYSDVNPFELYEYHVPYHVNPFNDSEYEKHELMYTYYDIDQNGTPELLIFESSWQQDICDIYAFDGTAAVKLFPGITLLDTRDMEFVSAAIYDDGTLCLMTGDSSPYRFNADGYTLETIPWDEWEWNRDKLISFDADMEILAQDIPSDEAEWKKLYIEYIKEKESSNPDKWGSIQYMYALIYVDDDDIPELYVNGFIEAEGDQICTIGNNNQVEACALNRTGGASYIERSGMICNFNGNMDYYPLNFYRLENGTFTELEDIYGREEITWSDSGESTEMYFWNDMEVSEEEFYDKWDNIMPLDDLKNPWDNRHSAAEIMAMIQSM